MKNKICFFECKNIIKCIIIYKLKCVLLNFRATYSYNIISQSIKNSSLANEKIITVTILKIPLRRGRNLILDFSSYREKL